jgi:hypothetical protein
MVVKFKQENNDTKPRFKQETSGTKPFLWTREKWDDNVEKTTVKTDTGKVKIDSEMVILNGTETPEQFMFWLKDYEDKILHNTRTTSVDGINVLKRIVSKEAQVTVMNAVSLFEKANNVNDIDSLKNLKVRQGIRTCSLLKELLDTLIMMIQHIPTND